MLIGDAITSLIVKPNVYWRDLMLIIDSIDYYNKSKGVIIFSFLVGLIPGSGKP